MNWKTGTPDHGRVVLAVVQQEHRRVIIRAVYLHKFTEEASYIDDVNLEKEYDEENDVYYCAEGWYEQIDYWGDLYSVYVDDPVTHWMELPKLP